MANKIYGKGDTKRLVKDQGDLTMEQVQLKTLKLAQSQLDNYKNLTLNKRANDLAMKARRVYLLEFTERSPEGYEG